MAPAGKLATAGKFSPPAPGKLAPPGKVTPAPAGKIPATGTRTPASEAASRPYWGAIGSAGPGYRGGGGGWCN